jgi:NADPH2:quinone reductase
VLAGHGVVAVYANEGATSGEASLLVRPLMVHNVRYQFVLVYTLLPVVKRLAVVDVAAAVADGVMGVGEEHGLPLHRYPLERTGDAHAAVEGGAVGKVLIDVPG